MTHLDEGTLLAIRDRALVDADAHEHLDECAVCSEALADTRARADVVARSLRALDGGPPIDVDAAKAAVRRRLDQHREAPPRAVPGLYRSLGRAAILVLLASGAVYALPNSPLRGWLSGGEESVAPAMVGGTEVPTATEGIEVAVPSVGLTISVTSAQVGQRIEVSWVDGERASVEAGSDSRYQVSATGLQVDVTPGDVRIRLPMDAGPLIVEVDGRIVLQKVDEGIDVQGDVVSRDENRIVFTVGPR